MMQQSSGDMGEGRTEEEAKEQSKRIRIAAGAATLGGVTCFMLPVVGGLTLACAGAAAAAMMTTRADEAGDAARASGAAVAVGFEKVSKLDLKKKVTSAYGKVLQKPPVEEKKEPNWWQRTFRSSSRLDRYGHCKTAGEAGELMVRELADCPRDSRRRFANEIIASLHPDRAHSVASRATATALTRVALGVREFFDDQGWDYVDLRGVTNAVYDLKKKLDRLS